MKTKFFNSITLTAIIFGVLTFSSCKDDTSDNEPNVDELFTTTWVLDKLLIDGTTYTGDITSYNLTLYADKSFTRTDIDGVTLTGTRQLISNNQILVLETEQYSIIKITSDIAELLGTTRNDKTGSADLTYTLSRKQ